MDDGGLILFKVNLPVNDSCVRYVQHDIEHKLPLPPVAKLLKVFSKLPEEERLHIANVPHV